MKKNFLISVALTVVAFFVATEIAVAADISFSGSFRTRYESSGRNDFVDATENDDTIATQVRLNAKVNINDSTSAFIQMQSNKRWGNNISQLGGNAGGNAGGSGNASFTASDADATVGLHEAYFTLKNFAGMNADLKLGRQQVVLDGHRLFGHTGWTTGAQTHDAARLTHKGDNHTITYVYIQANDSGDIAGAANDPGDQEDIDVHVLHANFQGILGGGLSLIYALTEDGCGDSSGLTAGCNIQANNIHTIGFRQAGKLYGINYRGEYYHQLGDARADATLNIANQTFATLASQGTIDRDAHMFGIRLGKKFSNVQMKPSLTIWYDYLSGTDDGDIENNTYGNFNTLFDTGHKFYGHMDLFLNARNNGTEGMGLTDFAIKGSIQPMPGWTVKGAYHWFGTATSPSGNPKALASDVASSVSDELGQEIDLQLIHKYNANTVISGGYSVFAGEQLFNSQRGGIFDDADWAYLQFQVKF